MLYDLSNPLQRQQFLSRADSLAKKGGTVELSTKKNRTLSQNAYLHCLFAYFGLHYGENAEYVKQVIFKRQVNKDIFMVERENEIRGRYVTARSTSTLSTEEMSIAIDRFRDFSSKECGLYLPTAQEGDMIRQIEVEVSRKQRYV